MFKLLKSILIITVFSVAAFAEENALVIYEYEGSFFDAAQSLQTAIEAQGLKVDHVSKVGDMLERTAIAAGANEKIYEDAQVFQFCSSILSRKMMEIDPKNLAYCPYQIFIFQHLGAENTVVGYRGFPDNEMKEIAELMEAIIEETLAF